jgi:hypothetical protein
MIEQVGSPRSPAGPWNDIRLQWAKMAIRFVWAGQRDRSGVLPARDQEWLDFEKVQLPERDVSGLITGEVRLR